mmetsp:Transcript_37982/g.87722  ORF Transcript_37982/g.87722 Transcript_37982/m.87722 type:complete len:220 (+) Transcript_37982:2625-3284(+)
MARLSWSSTWLPRPTTGWNRSALSASPARSTRARSASPSARLRPAWSARRQPRTAASAQRVRPSPRCSPPPSHAHPLLAPAERPCRSARRLRLLALGASRRVPRLRPQLHGGLRCRGERVMAAHRVRTRAATTPRGHARQPGSQPGATDGCPSDANDGNAPVHSYSVCAAPSLERVAERLSASPPPVGREVMTWIAHRSRTIARSRRVPSFVLINNICS